MGAAVLVLAFAAGAVNKKEKRVWQVPGKRAKTRVPKNSPNPPEVLLAKTEFLDQGAVFENVFFGVVAKQAFALTNLGQQGTARGVIFFELAQVGREALDLVGQQGYLYFHVAGVLIVFAVGLDDLGDFFF